MSLKEYLKDNLRYFVLWLLMLGIIDFFLIMFKITSSLIWIITIVILSSMIIIYGYDYYRKSIFYQDFINKLNKLDKKCLITELIKKPNFLDGKILYDSLYEIDKSMYEEIEQYLQNINDFKEYIELWVHEVKLPIASSKLMIYNHETDKRKLQEQINRIENYVEQVLYYIRLENSEHDYLLKKCNLGKIIHKVIKRNQDSLLFHKISIEIKNINEIVISDSKWLEFIINQIISNSIKYRSKKDCKILFNV
ncbi:MAG: sensor histidine kinase, partial [Thomasclavelia sp.]